MKNLLILSILICFQTICYQKLEAQTRAFYIGHSLSDQIPDMVQSLSDDSVDHDFDWVYQSIPGAPLRWQWERRAAQDYEPTDPHYYGYYDEDHGLASGDFDVLVLTEAVPRYLDIIEETHAYTDSFYKYAITHNPDIQIYLYEDWHCLLSGTPTGCDYDIDASTWRQRLTDDLPMWEGVVDHLNTLYEPAYPICLIPAGQGLAALYDSIQIGVIPDIERIEDLFEDNIHLNDIGKYYIACIHYAMIHRSSPVGLKEQLQYWWGGDFIAPSRSLASKLQEMAWETVITYPNTCLDRFTTSTDLLLDSDGISILPNPTLDSFEIRGLVGNYEIQILDVTGHIYQELSDIEEDIIISLDSLPSGVYFIRISSHTANKLIIEKLIKQL